MRIILSLLLTFISICTYAQGKVTDYVDPRIGSEGLGRVFIGPSCPYGMVKPGPDCGVDNNAGWTTMPAAVSGFSQTHVSGTGGGPKYGNILLDMFDEPQHRTSEDIRLGYYACNLQESKAKVEITTSERASYYRVTVPHSYPVKLRFDLEHFLGKSPVPKAREAQQYEGSCLLTSTPDAASGWQCISGGWNNGAPYKVFFFAKMKKTEGTKEDVADIKIGISFVSVDKARQNLEEDIPHWDFQRTYDECIDKWKRVLGKVQLAESTPEREKRMFYTALYHTMLMPVDRTNDNGLYDDYYAIWDTYRTSTPLLSLLDPQRATAIAASLLDIYKQTGYMPDARSGNSNGRTQGGSNAEIVIADALAKGLKLDYKLALEAMIKDATVAPKDDEAEGRGGLKEYNTLGYVPYGVARGGNRTVEYAFCDWSIAQVAKHLGKQKVYDKYMAQSERWKNLWRKDYEHDGARGFILPRNAEGEWLDSVPFGHSRLNPQAFHYTPDVSYEGPWYCAWWDCFFYEASSWEYSFSIPHDIPALVEACGGNEAFERRLDTFFALGYYNVANEPSFLTPCLYHWVGRPDKTSYRVKSIINRSYSDAVDGIPGNDDGGAMSSWYAFHAMGLYPNAGHDYYIVHEPLLDSLTITLDNGKMVKIKTIKGNKSQAFFNGKLLQDNRITHSLLLKGGELCIEKPQQYRFVYKLHGQTRRFDVTFSETADGQLVLRWGIKRNLRYWEGDYAMSASARAHATNISYIQPLDGQHIDLPDTDLFGVISRDVYNDIINNGKCRIANTDYRLVGTDGNLLHIKDDAEGAEMWIRKDINLPIIMRIANNPAEINYEVQLVE